MNIAKLKKIIIKVYKNQLITFAKRQTFHICGANISLALRISPDKVGFHRRVSLDVRLQCLSTGNYLGDLLSDNCLTGSVILQHKSTDHFLGVLVS